MSTDTLDTTAQLCLFTLPAVKWPTGYRVRHLRSGRPGTTCGTNEHGVFVKFRGSRRTSFVRFSELERI